MSRKPIVLMLTVVSMLAALSLSLAAGAAAATPQRIDMKVLVLGTSATEPDFVSWQSALQREGVPFQAIVTSPGHAPITASTLSDTLANGTAEAKYQAIIVSVGGLPECTSTCASTLTTAEWSALEEYEHTFNVRQITGDIFPSAAYGLSGPTTSGALDGIQGTLTTEGKTVFPYLKELVGMDTGTYGYEATPLTTQATGASFAPLVQGPGGSALVGIYTHPNGVQEMVESFDQNSYQLQSELLRHGALNWVTRGVYFGDQRNYVEMDIDDTFTPDDSWDTATHQINYDNNDALRMQPIDVDYAAKWAKEHGNFRMEQLFNGGGSVEYQEDNGGIDPVLAEFQKEDPETKKPYADSFGWLSHTYDTPYLDVGCATQNYIEAELNENTAWAAAKPGATPGTGGLGLTQSSEPSVALGAENPKVFVPGNHSGFADLVPGNPATVDEPDLDASSVNQSGGSLPQGSYQYAVTDQFVDSSSAGQSAAYITEPLAVPAGGSVTLEWESICHAADYTVYREPAGSGKWSLLGTLSTPFSATLPDNSVGEAASSTNVQGGGESQQTFLDSGAPGTAEPAGWTPPSSENALESAWEQNPYFIPALEAVGITAVGDDASKGYPDPPQTQFGIGTTYSGPEYAPGETFLDGTAQVVPRHPINIYYNASTEAQEVDEYNTLYLPPSLGGECVASATTTCESAPATFSQIVSSVVSGMFQNMMGNDPRPSYVHQTNIIGHPPAGPATTGTPPATPEKTGDGLLYSVLNPLLEEYAQYFAQDAPYEQLTLGAIGTLLGEQSAWKAAQSSVSGYIEGATVTLTNSGTQAISVPLTGVTGVGSLYGGIQSGWTSLPVSTTSYSAPTAWPAPAAEATTPAEAPKVLSNPVSKTVTAPEGATFTASASGSPAPSVQWQVSTNAGVTFTNDTTDAGNTTTTLSVASTSTALSAHEYRAVFTNSGGAATSTAAVLTVNPKPEAPKLATNPASKTVTAPEGATFTASASGVPAPTVQWQVSTNAGVSFANDTSDAGNTTGTLTVASTSTALSAHEYRAVFTNSAGTATSTAATLTVNPKPEAPKVSANPAAKSVTAGEGATFTAAASGVPAPTVQWQVSTNGGLTFASDTSDSGYTTGTLSVATTTAMSGREYRAVFTNSAGSATSTAATLTVSAPAVDPFAGILALNGFYSDDSVEVTGNIASNAHIEMINPGVKITGKLQYWSGTSAPTVANNACAKTCSIEKVSSKFAVPAPAADSEAEYVKAEKTNNDRNVAWPATYAGRIFNESTHVLSVPASLPSTVTLPSGTYFVCSAEFDGKVTFATSGSGPVIVYIGGPKCPGGKVETWGAFEFINSSGNPNNLQFYFWGSPGCTTKCPEGINFNNLAGSRAKPITANVFAPYSTMRSDDSVYMDGSLVVASGDFTNTLYLTTAGLSTPISGSLVSFPQPFSL